jgi:hypothetical protein
MKALFASGVSSSLTRALAAARLVLTPTHTRYEPSTNANKMPPASNATAYVR